MDSYTSDAFNSLFKFLDKYKIIKSDSINKRHSHISMYDVKASYDIPFDKMEQFYKLYKKALKYNCKLGILEAHLDKGPIIIDIDMKYILNSNSISRIYTLDDIKSIITIYNNEIKTLFNVTDDELQCYILEKNEPKLQLTDDLNGKKTYKDGFHLIYPNLCVDNQIQYYIREKVIDVMENQKTINHLGLSNDLNDVIDKAVIERNGWLLYGSSKDGNDSYTYKLTSIINHDNTEEDLEDIDHNNLCSYLSIRKYNNVYHTEFKPDYNIEKIKDLHDQLYISKRSVTNKLSCVSKDDNIRARKLIEIINKNRSDNYKEWIEIGFCLHNIDYSLLDVWIEFSKQSIKFKNGECEKLWESFKFEGLTIATLHKWAKEDNPDLYCDYILSEYEDLLKKSLFGTSYHIAKVFYEMYKYNYVCSSIKHKKWYEFKNHRWIPMDEANGIIKKLNDDLVNIYIKYGTALNIKALNNKHLTTEDKEYLLKSSKTSINIAMKLNKMAFKREVISELIHLYYDRQFIELLDENRDLICFNNGIYDLKNNTFRSGRPEDYISLCTNCDYTNYDENNLSIKKVNNFFKDIQPDYEMREYLLRRISSFLEGRQREQKFEIWTGTGANGKGRILKLVLDSFGDYACTIPITLLTTRRADSNQATPALATTKGKRCCIFQEPENDDKIYVGHMKNLTGGDKIMARQLYAEPIEFYPQFKTILACNKLPQVPSNDGGTWRRVRVVPFEIKFVDNPIAPNERKKDKKLDDEIGEWKSAFMSLLVSKYKLYITEGIEEPNKVLITTNQYQQESDIYMEYITDKILITGLSDDKISINTLYEDFKQWVKDTNPSITKKFNRQEVVIEMGDKLGPIIKNKYFTCCRYKQDDDEEYMTHTDNKLNSSINVLSDMLLNTNSDIQSDEEIRRINKLFQNNQNKISELDCI